MKLKVIGVCSLPVPGLPPLSGLYSTMLLAHPIKFTFIILFLFSPYDYKIHGSQ